LERIGVSMRARAHAGVWWVESGNELVDLGRKVDLEKASGSLRYFDQFSSTPLTCCICVCLCVAAEDLITFSRANVTVTESDSAALNTGTYTIQLAAAPTSTVLVFFSTTVSDFAASPSVIQFTASSWNVQQTITIQATNDNVDEETETFQLGHAMSSADATYNEKTEYMPVIINDDDTGELQRKQDAYMTTSTDRSSSYFASSLFMQLPCSSWGSLGLTK
jgi:hypothetical protein